MSRPGPKAVQQEAPRADNRQGLLPSAQLKREVPKPRSFLCLAGGQSSKVTSALSPGGFWPRTEEVLIGQTLLLKWRPFPARRPLPRSGPALSPPHWPLPPRAGVGSGAAAGAQATEGARGGGGWRRVRGPPGQEDLLPTAWGGPEAATHTLQHRWPWPSGSSATLPEPELGLQVPPSSEAQTPRLPHPHPPHTPILHPVAVPIRPAAPQPDNSGDPQA